jgi:hypothetical protein
MKPPGLGEIRARFSAMSDEQFARLVREDLTSDGQVVYDEELNSRSGDDWAQARADAEAERERLRPNEALSEKPAIAGWLLLPATGLIISPMIAVKTLIDEWSFVTDPGFASLDDRFPGLATFALTSLVITHAWLIGLAYVAVAFFRKTRHAPMLMIGLLAANGVLVTLEWSRAVSVLGSDQRLVEQLSPEIARAMFGAAVWIPYFLKSERVKRTFSTPDPAPEPLNQELPGA